MTVIVSCISNLTNKCHHFQHPTIKSTFTVLDHPACVLSVSVHCCIHIIVHFTYPLAGITLRVGGMVRFKRVQRLFCEGEDTRRGLHAQEVHWWDRLNQIQVSRMNESWVSIVTYKQNGKKGRKRPKRLIKTLLISHFLIYEAYKVFIKLFLSVAWRLAIGQF